MDINEVERYYANLKAEVEKLKTDSTVRAERIRRYAEELSLEVDSNLPIKAKELKETTDAQILEIEEQIRTGLAELEALKKQDESQTL